MLQISIGSNGAVNQSGGQAGVSLVSVGGSYHLSGGTFSSPSTNVNGSVSYDGGVLSLGTLQMNSGGQIHLGSGGGKVLRATSLSIGTVGGGGFNSGIDLSDNAMLVDYTGTPPLALIASYIHGGTFDGLTSTAHGIISSTAIIGGGVKTLAYCEASALGASTFEGYSVDSTTVIVRYTYPGDANFDGTVNALDFNAVATNFGSASRTWAQGDFNFDGITNTLDFNLLAKNFNQSLPGPAWGDLSTRGRLPPRPRNRRSGRHRLLRARLERVVLGRLEEVVDLRAHLRSVLVPVHGSGVSAAARATSSSSPMITSEQLLSLGKRRQSAIIWPWSLLWLPGGSSRRRRQVDRLEDRVSSPDTKTLIETAVKRFLARCRPCSRSSSWPGSSCAAAGTCRSIASSCPGPR